MATIIQGTTPSLKINISTEDLLLSDVKQVELVFAQKGVVELTKHIEDVDVDLETNSITYHFTEKETMDLFPKREVEWQLRLQMSDDELIATQKATFDVADLISKEVMTE